ncbi:MAG TPA: hypothetical protein VGC10_03690 [Sphingomonas sp.]
MEREAVRKPVHPTEESVRARFGEAGLDVPDECIRGTVANLIVLQNHVRTLRGLPLDDHDRSALEFRV